MPLRRWQPDERRPHPRRPAAAPAPAPALKVTQARVLRLGVDQVPLPAVHRVDPAGRRRPDDRHRRAVLGGDRQPVPHLQPGRPGRLQPRQHQPERASPSPWSPSGCSGCCMMSGEYSTGMIRSSLTAVPAPPAGAVGEAGRLRGRDLLGLARGQLHLLLPRPGAAEQPPPRRVDHRSRRAAVGHRRRPVRDRGRPDRRRPGRAAAQHRGGHRHLRRGVLRHPAAGRAAARLDQRPPDPVPALQRRGRSSGAGRRA